jgi:hypothetical protein
VFLDIESQKTGSYHLAARSPVDAKLYDRRNVGGRNGSFEGGIVEERIECR